jgi:hypothetical protein
LAHGWSIVGENGPELVNFTDPGRVYSAGQTAAAMGWSGESSGLLRDLLGQVQQLTVITASYGKRDLANGNSLSNSARKNSAVAKLLYARTPRSTNEVSTL